MFTWVRGTRLLAKATKRNEADLDWLVRKLEAKPPHRVPGTAVFLTGDPYAAPTSMMHNLKHNRVMHERNILLSIKTEETPRVPRHERVTIERVSDHFIRIIARYGFMETPSVPKILEHCKRKDCSIEMGATSFFLSRRSLRVTSKSEMPRWQERLLYRAGRQCRGRDDLLPDPDRSRRRSRNPSGCLSQIADGTECSSQTVSCPPRQSDVRTSREPDLVMMSADGLRLRLRVCRLAGVRDVASDFCQAVLDVGAGHGLR